jgi:oxygen-independent coproporphyrinogen-3 oxidase
MDLIYGVEGQTLRAWLDTLKRALHFKPFHLSCYQLSIEPGTLFEEVQREGGIRPLGEKTERAFFLLTSNFLETNGYIHYEVSNFARNESCCSRHNRKYWDHTPYLGLGPSAHSFSGKKRWWNVDSVDQYIGALNAGKAPLEDFELLTDDQLKLESVALGLRTIKGVSLKELPRSRETKRKLAWLQNSGCLKRRNNRVIPTKKGFLVADSLPVYLA